MFGKIKFFIVCAMVTIGFSACSSDDGITSKPKVTSKEYQVLVTISDDVEMGQITTLIFNGSTVVTEVLVDKTPVVVVEGQEVKKILKWEKTYTVKSNENVSIVADAEGVDLGSELKITISDKDGLPLIKKESKGKKLFVEATF